MSGTTPRVWAAIGTPRAANRKRRNGCAACSAAWLTATTSPTTCSPSTSTATGAPTPCAARGKFCAVPRRACSISAAAPATSCWPSPRRGRPVLGSDFCHPMLVAARDKIAVRRSPGRAFRIRRLNASRCAMRRSTCSPSPSASAIWRTTRPASSKCGACCAPAAWRRSSNSPSRRMPLFGALYNFYCRRILPWIGGLISGSRDAYTLPAGVGPQVSHRSANWPS